MTPFHVTTVVWGREFCELFLDVCVPNQMTAGNLGALPAGSRYRVFTSAEDRKFLQSSSALRAIGDRIPVDIIVEPLLSTSIGTQFTRMTACHATAIRDASESGAALIFLSPDIVLSEGTLAAVVRSRERGHRAVVCPGLRVDRDAFRAALASRGADPLSSRELVSLALDHLHPFTRAHMIDGVPGARRPIGVYWDVPGDGILAHGLYLHPLMVDPSQPGVMPDGTIDQHYLFHACPNRADVHVASDSDEFVVFEMSHIDAAVTETGPEPISAWRAARMLCRCDPHQRTYWVMPLRLHAHDLGPAWRAVEKEASRFVHRVAALRRPALWVYVTSRRIRPWTRPVEKLRKRTARAGRRVWRRARTAL